MQHITLVTGNLNKLRELQAVFPASLQLTSQKLDLDEIQSLDLYEIVRRKLRQAYGQVRGPVIVEDVSAELEKLNGLPGPFIKYFEERLGKGALYKLGGEGRIKVVCVMGYYDGQTEHIVEGVLEGKVVTPDLSGSGEGFGFDFVIIPDGYDKTMSQLGLNTKNTISHRFKAASTLIKVLQDK